MSRLASICPIIVRPLKDGRATVYIRITKDAKQSLYALAIRVLPQHFDKSSSCGIDNPNWISKKHPLCKEYNELIKKELIRLDPFKSENALNCFQIKQQIIVPPDKSTFNDFWVEMIKRFEKEKKMDLAEKHTSEKNKFDSFRKDVLLKDVNHDLVSKYQTFLLTINNANTTSKSLEFLKRITTEAFNSERLTKNPFANFKIKRPGIVTSNAKKGALNKEEVLSWARLPFVIDKDESLWTARNFFLVQMYGGGARVGEILTLEVPNAMGDYLIYEMEKKGDGKAKQKHVLITPELRNILDLHIKPGAKYVFPYMEGLEHLSEMAFRKRLRSCTTIINNALSRIAPLCGIEKHISSHSARHTIGQLLKKSGLAMKEIQNYLGHESEEETQNYTDTIVLPTVINETATLVYELLRVG